MNAKKVPQIFVSSGAAKWNDPKNFPWTIGWQPSYQVEARIYAAYILKNYPGKTIGVLYQNDDFGKDYVIGLREGLGDQAGKLIIIEASYETSAPTVDSQVVQIKTANPDIFINVATPKFAAQAIKKVAELAWHPVHFLTNVSVSVGGVMKPAGYENDQGILSASYLKDPKDPQWKNDPAMNEWRAFMTKWYPEGDQEDASTTFGYGVAKGLEQVLRQCKDDLTRENVMRQAANLNFEIGSICQAPKSKPARPISRRSNTADDALQGRDLGVVRPDHERRKELLRISYLRNGQPNGPFLGGYRGNFFGRDDRRQIRGIVWGVGPAQHGAGLTQFLENAPVDALVDMLFSRICGIEKRAVLDRIGR